MMFRIAPLLLALAAPLAAQTCPDLELDRVDQKVTVGPTIDCSTLRYVWRGIQLGQGVQGCPSFVLIEPGYDSTRHRAGAGTYAVPDGRMAVTQLTFICEITMLLFIPISSSCERINERVIGHRTNYAFHPCALLPVATEPQVVGS